MASISDCEMGAAFLDRLARMANFVWSCWVGIAALALFAAAWQQGYEAWGSFILPSPLDTLAAAAAILRDPTSWRIVADTASRALSGFAIAAGAGAAIGLAVGHAPAALRLARPLLTILLGVPPIAWIVLALIWFGSSDATVIATVIVSATPLVFVGAAEGIITRDRGLDDMARAFGAGPLTRLQTLSLRHMAAHLFPALTIALGMSFKVAVMSELLANVGGIGGRLAVSRAYLDITGSLAWILVSVIALIAVEYLVVHPARAETERWRVAAQPWGVKR